MQIQTTDSTIAVILEPEEARELLDAIITSRRDVSSLSQLIHDLDVFTNAPYGE